MWSSEPKLNALFEVGRDDNDPEYRALFLSPTPQSKSKRSPFVMSSGPSTPFSPLGTPDASNDLVEVVEDAMLSKHAPVPPGPPAERSTGAARSLTLSKDYPDSSGTLEAALTRPTLIQS